MKRSSGLVSHSSSPQRRWGLGSREPGAQERGTRAKERAQPGAANGLFRAGPPPNTGTPSPAAGEQGDGATVCSAPRRGGSTRESPSPASRQPPARDPRSRAAPPAPPRQPLARDSRSRAAPLAPPRQPPALRPQGVRAHTALSTDLPVCNYCSPNPQQLPEAPRSRTLPQRQHTQSHRCHGRKCFGKWTPLCPPGQHLPSPQSQLPWPWSCSFKSLTS